MVGSGRGGRARGCRLIPNWIGAARFELATFGPPDQRANQAAPRPAARRTVAHAGPSSRLPAYRGMRRSSSRGRSRSPASLSSVAATVGERPVAHRRGRDLERGLRRLARAARRSRAQACSPRRPADGRSAAARSGGRRQPARHRDAARLAQSAAARGLPRLPSSPQVASDRPRRPVRLRRRRRQRRDRS